MAERERSAVVIVRIRVTSIGFEPWQFHPSGLKIYYCKWHERALFLHLPKDTCATAIGQPSRLWVLLLHSCALKCFKLGSSLSSVLFTANIERSWSQTRRRVTPRSVTWVVPTRNRPAIQLPAEFHLRQHSAEPEKVMTGKCKAYDRYMQFRLEPEKIHLVYT